VAVTVAVAAAGRDYTIKARAIYENFLRVNLDLSTRPRHNRRIQIAVRASPVRFKSRLQFARLAAYNPRPRF